MGVISVVAEPPMPPSYEQFGYQIVAPQEFCWAKQALSILYISCVIFMVLSYLCFSSDWDVNSEMVSLCSLVGGWVNRPLLCRAFQMKVERS